MVVTLRHFRSRDKDGDYTIQSAIAETLCYVQTLWLYVLYNRSIIADRKCTLRQ